MEGNYSLFSLLYYFRKLQSLSAVFGGIKEAIVEMLKECLASEFGYGYRKKNTILTLMLKYLANYNDINCVYEKEYEPNMLSDMFIFLC